VPGITKCVSSDSVVTRAAGTRSGQRTLKFLGGNKKAKVITLEIDGLIDQVFFKYVLSGIYWSNPKILSANNIPILFFNYE